MNANEFQLTGSDIEAALEKNELELFYQPKVCLLRGTVIGAEALVRWCRNDGTVIGPDHFIPLAEQSGLLHSITVKMLEQAVESIERLHRSYPELTLSMNVTPYDLESHHISRLIEGYLQQKRIKPSDLQVEITESAVMSDFDRVYDDLLRLNTLGIKVLMDDFGTGYSSIDRLSRLPFSSLKLDKGVVSRMGSSRQNLDVVKSSISMARELRMTSVAEGLESEGAYNFLLANGCEEAQGFWISKPLQFDDYERFLESNPGFHGSQIGRVHQATFNIIHFRKSLVDAAYCNGISSDTVLDSVIDPEVQQSVENSRFGLWYYGVGQVLRGIESFDELEEPFIQMHESGRQFMQQLNSDADAMTLDKALADVDQRVATLGLALRKLERHLLLTSQTSTSDTTGNHQASM